MKNLALAVTMALSKAARGGDDAAALQYFRARISGILADPNAEHNCASKDGIFLSWEEAETALKEPPTIGMMGLIAIHECIHYDMRHPWQIQLTHSILKKRHDDAQVAARLQVMTHAIEWQTNLHMMQFAEPIGLSEKESSAVLELADHYGRAKDEMKEIIGDDWKTLSPMRLALTLPDDKIEQMAEKIQQLMDKLSESAKQLADMMGGDAEKGDGESDCSGAIPSDEELERGTMTEQEELMHNTRIAETAKQQKYQGGHVDSAIEFASEAFSVEIDPVAIFQQYLRQVQGTNKETWGQPHRGYRHMGLYLPSKYDHALRELGVIVDTSGSMSRDELGYACGVLYECAGALSKTRIRVLSVDTAIRRSEEVYSAADIQSAVTLSGGGGTDFGPALQIIKDDAPTILAIITDGYVDVSADSNPEIPVVWFLTADADSNFSPPFGKVIPAAADEK